MTTTTTTNRAAVSQLITIALARVADAVADEDFDAASLTCYEAETFAGLLMAGGHTDAAVQIIRTHALYDMSAEGDEDDWHRPSADEDFDAWVSTHVHCLIGASQPPRVAFAALVDVEDNIAGRWMSEGREDAIGCGLAFALAGLLAVGGYQKDATAIARHHRLCCDADVIHDPRDAQSVKSAARAITEALTPANGQ